jgi:Calcineurin-like phosphoesterase
MIAEFLNEDFLLEAAEDTRLELKGVVEKRERREPVDEGPLSEVTDEEIREVTEELNRVVGELDAKDVKRPKDAEMFVPREPILAILQTELTRVSSEQQPDAFVGDPEGVTERRIADDPEDRTEDGRRAWGKYEVTRPKILSDPRWLWSGVVIAWHKFKRKVDFGGLPGEAVAIADDARILLMGDWGSGLERARAVSKHMRAVLEQGLADGREQHVVHLGDVYYTGSEEEYENNLLAHWPVKNDEDIGSYTLCGNHDMYRGGHAYYGTALADPRFARQGGKSVFALRNEAWQILGLDTGYEDAGLGGGQPAWIADQIDASPDRRTALLSHHQLWSAYEDAGGKLREALKDVLPARPIDVWFWAHEHRCLAYDARDGVGFASCVGHGGIPEYLIAAEGEPYPSGLRFDYRKKHGDGIEPWNTFGFAIVDLDGRTMKVSYVDESGGEPHHTEEVPA